MGNLPDPRTSQLVTLQESAAMWKEVLYSRIDELQAALPKHVSAPYLIRTVLTSAQRTPKLLGCTPASMYRAVLQCAQLGLVPDSVLGLIYLTPRYSKHSKAMEVSVIPGYIGLMQLARRSGEITVCEAHEVFPSDKFEYQAGTDQYLHHIPAHAGDEELTFVWALARIRGESHPQFQVLDREQVEASRKRSGTPDEGPWVTDYVAMAKKTVLRRLCKYLPVSTELMTAVALDERAEAGIPQDLPEPEKPVVEISPVKVPEESEK